MSLSVNTQVGPNVLSDGVNATTLRLEKLGALVVQELHGAYYEQAYRGNLFFAAAGGVTSSVGLSTTYTGLCISNPLGSNVNLVMNKISFAQSVINAAVNAIGYGVGYSATTNVTHTTPVTPASCKYGSGLTPIAKADSSATLPTAPVYAGFLGSTPTATTNPNGGVWDLQGSILVPPGAYFCILTAAASPASALWLGAQWEEVAI